MAYNIRILVLIIILESILLGFRNPLISAEIDDPGLPSQPEWNEWTCLDLKHDEPWIGL